MRVPRFKDERTTNLVIRIGKIITMMIMTAMTYPFIIFLSEMTMTQETWLLYVGGTAVGAFCGMIKFHGEVNERTTRWIVFLSCLTIMFVANLMMNIGDKALITILGLLGGIAIYAGIKYNFSDLEQEARKFHDENRQVL